MVPVSSGGPTLSGEPEREDRAAMFVAISAVVAATRRGTRIFRIDSLSVAKRCRNRVVLLLTLRCGIGVGEKSADGPQPSGCPRGPRRSAHGAGLASQIRRTEWRPLGVAQTGSFWPCPSAVLTLELARRAAAAKRKTRPATRGSVRASSAASRTKVEYMPEPGVASTYDTWTSRTPAPCQAAAGLTPPEHHRRQRRADRRPHPGRRVRCHRTG